WIIWKSTNFPLLAYLLAACGARN
ncbi:alpha/beta hydrolase fold family protein, partial [Vibrio parahaemolyticus V-223/04]